MLQPRHAAPESLPWAVVSAAAEGADAPIDPNGNLTSKVEDGHSWTYEWNAENQLKRVLKDAVEVAKYAYDPVGRRVEKIAGGVTTTYAYDSEDILKQTAGATTVRYVHGLGVDEPLATENGAGQLSYEHGDGLGSELKQTDAAGAVTFSRSYDAFGQLQAGVSTSGYAYTGREWDPEIGLYYYRARYYDPKIGRFLSEDPLGFEGGINPYAYVENNPVRWTDPFGLTKLDPSDSWTYKGRRYRTVACDVGQEADCIERCAARGGMKKCRMLQVWKVTRYNWKRDVQKVVSGWEYLEMECECNDSDDDDDSCPVP